ncbi:potassium channel family protein [Alteromonas antoniana]|uniref:potassium channel family protein n=1 Tax=Alteromonas antoniana TaxID=2803813 RepID=UPI001C477F5B|nr:potassium channel family protein [Alteromonas antoniana]
MILQTIKRQYFLYLVFYVGMSVVFAWVYVENGEAFDNKITSFYDAYYFSVVIITTLGFGDISPVTTAMKMTVLAEVLLGITTFGLVLNTIAESRANLQEQKLSEAAKAHFLNEYKHFKRQIVRVILASSEHSLSPEENSEIPSEESLQDFKAFREFFSSRHPLGDKIYKKFVSDIDDKGAINSATLNEVFMELEILSDSTNYLLHTINTSNWKSHNTLMLVSQAPKRYRESYNFQSEQGKYVGRLLFEIMASYSSAKGPLQEDFIKTAVRAL